MSKIILLLSILFLLCSCKKTIDEKKSEGISNPQASELYQEAQREYKKGNDGLKNAIDLLNKADSIEPMNPIIIHERGLVKFRFGIDIIGAFVDLNNSISYSIDKKALLFRYTNRGLCYMDICDIKSACSDWKKAGKLGRSYIDKYCKTCSDTLFGSNSDNNIEVIFELKDSIARIISPHNPPSMSDCFAKILIKNNNNGDLMIFGSSLDFGLSKDSCSLFLEAKLHNGEKFIFFTNSTYSYYLNDKEIVIRKGDSFTQEQNITYLHQFPYPGLYEVRVAIRPTVVLRGIERTYYSNWETLRVED